MHLGVRDVADRCDAGPEAHVGGQRQVAVGEHERRAGHARAQELEAGDDDIEVVERRRRARAEDQRRPGGLFGGPEAVEVDAEIDDAQPLGRRAASDERAPHVIGAHERDVGRGDRGVGLLEPVGVGQVDVRSPRGGHHRAVRHAGRDPAPARQPVGLDDVWLDPVQDVAQPVHLGAARVVALGGLGDVVERQGAPSGLVVTGDEDGVPERPGALRPALRVADVQRAELQDAEAGAGDQPC